MKQYIWNGRIHLSRTLIIIKVYLDPWLIHRDLIMASKMAAWRDYFVREGYTKLAEAKKYAEEMSLDDPEDDPYRSLYIARDHYNAVKKVLKKNVDKGQEDNELVFVMAALELKLGLFIASFVK